MLFVLRDDVVSHCNAAAGVGIEGLQNLLIAIRQGLHAASGPYQIFAALATNQNLSSRERATAKKLANRRADLQLIETLIKNKVFISGLPNKPLKRLDDFSWEVGIENLKPSWMGSFTVLAENLVDAELYCKAAQHYQVQNCIKSSHTNCVPRGGGGSQVDVEFSQLLLQGGPVLAITDGDLMHPMGEKSVISKRCDSALNSLNGVGWHVALQAREIENIVPHLVLFDAADPAVRSAALDSISELFESGNDVGKTPCMFTCLKAGKKLNEVFQCTDQAEKIYWLSVVKQIQSRHARFSAECLDQNACNQDFCSCSVNLGFGKDVLHQVKVWLDTKGPHEALKSFSKNTLWMEIGKLVFETTVAFKVERI